MIFVSTSKRLTDSLHQFLCGQDALRFNDAVFAMHPHGLDRIQPRTLDGQRTYDQAHPCALALNLLVMGVQPTLHGGTEMPRGIVPDQGQHPFTKGVGLFAAPFQEAHGQIAHWMPLREAQPDFFLCRRILPAHQQSVTDQRLRPWGIFRQSLVQQADRLRGLRPNIQVRLSESTPPRFIFKAQDPVGLRASPADQAIPCVFLRAYAGSGLVIQCLARAHFIPNRRSVARIVSPLTCSAVRPCSKLTSAANAKVHTLLALPKARGLWCNRWRNRFRLVRGKGRCDPMRTVRAPLQDAQSGLVERLDDFPHGLVIAAQLAGNGWGTLPAGTRQNDLAAAHYKAIGRTHASLQLKLFGRAQRTDKDGSLHAAQYSAFPPIWSAHALGRR